MAAMSFNQTIAFIIAKHSIDECSENIVFISPVNDINLQTILNLYSLVLYSAYVGLQDRLSWSPTPNAIGYSADDSLLSLVNCCYDVAVLWNELTSGNNL